MDTRTDAADIERDWGEYEGLCVLLYVRDTAGFDWYAGSDDGGGLGGA
jgi:hypothetical protein